MIIEKLHVFYYRGLKIEGLFQRDWERRQIFTNFLFPQIPPLYFLFFSSYYNNHDRFKDSKIYFSTEKAALARKVVWMAPQRHVFTLVQGLPIYRSPYLNSKRQLLFFSPHPSYKTAPLWPLCHAQVRNWSRNIFVWMAGVEFFGWVRKYPQKEIGVSRILSFDFYQCAGIKKNFLFIVSQTPDPISTKPRQNFTHFSWIHFRQWEKPTFLYHRVFQYCCLAKSTIVLIVSFSLVSSELFWWTLKVPPFPAAKSQSN